MATIKFSEFNAGNINVAGAQLVGLTGGNTATNARFTAADLVNGLATVTYVDAQDASLQSQITQNTNDIANIDLSGLQSNVSTLQGQVSVLQGNIVVLDSAVAALENNVSVNQDDIAVLQGNVIQIENDLANINTDSQTLTWDTANANLSISGGNTVTLDGLGGDSNIAVATASDGQDYLTTFDTSFFITADPLATDTGYIAFGEAFNTNWNAGAYELHGAGSGKGMFNGKTITNKVAADATVLGIATANDIYLGTRYAALYTDNSYDVTLSSDPLGHVALAIDTVDKLVIDGPDDEAKFTIGNVTVNGDNVLQTLTWDQANSNLTISGGNTVTINVGGGSPGNYSNANVAAYAEAGWAGNIVPSANITYDLGNITNRWKDLYLSNATIFLGNTELSTANGAITVNGTEVKNQSLSLDNSSNVLSISGGNSVDFTTVLGNVAGGGGGGLAAVVDDTSPQLGGTLDTNGFNIEVSNGGPLEFGIEWNDGNGTKYGDIVAQPDSNEFEISSGSGARDLIIVGDRDVEIKTGLTGRDIIIGDLTWPDSDGTANQVLVTDGSGQLSFAAGGVRLANLDIANATISSNSATNSMDVQFDSKPVAKITSGVMVQVHGSWDASAGAAFNWGTDEIASHGISNVTRDSTGIYTVTFETPFASNAYTATFGVGSTDYSGGGASPREVSLLSRNAGNCQVICERSDDAVNEDNFYMSLMICGVI